MQTSEVLLLRLGAGLRHMGHRLFDELSQYIEIDVVQLVDIQTGFACLVFAKIG
jgi:hypothetical protein